MGQIRNRVFCWLPLLLGFSMLCGCSMHDQAVEKHAVNEVEAPESKSESVYSGTGDDMEIFIPDDPDDSEVDHINPGKWSETESFDISARFLPESDEEYKSITVISDMITIKKHESKTWAIDISGVLQGPVHDTVSVEIVTDGKWKYRYISEDVSKKKELANFSNEGGITRVLSNLAPGSKVEITIINLGIVPLDMKLIIRTYDSRHGELITD